MTIYGSSHDKVEFVSSAPGLCQLQGLRSRTACNLYFAIVSNPVIIQNSYTVYSGEIASDRVKFSFGKLDIAPSVQEELKYVIYLFK